MLDGQRIQGTDPPTMEPGEEELAEVMRELRSRRSRAGRRFAARRPKRIDDVLSRVMSRKGYANRRQSAELEAAWREAAGEFFAQRTRPGKLQRGVLEVVVASSTLIHELGFVQDEILARLVKLEPTARVSKLRFRCGPIA